MGYYIRDVNALQRSNGNVVRINIYHLLRGSSCLDLLFLRIITSHLHPFILLHATSHINHFHIVKG